MSGVRTVELILDQARWAPSGDNTQPWRFEIVDDQHVAIHGFDTRDHCVYDLDGHPSQISLGALLETMRIAASTHGWRMSFQRRSGLPDTRPVIDVFFAPDAQMPADRLAASIPKRSVQRRPLSTKALSAQHKQALEAAAGEAYEVVWLEGFSTRLSTARLMFRNAHLRLTMPEAYRVHKDIIEWNARYSEDRVPDQALGVDAMTAKTMRFVMHSWQRVAFFNRYLAGTVAPRVQMDFVPALACAAHFVILARRPPQGIDDYIEAGRALQRFWLTVTDLGLQMQPEMTPLIFSRYARDGIAFSSTAGKAEEAAMLARRFDALIGADNARRSVYMGRVGAGQSPASRSVRLPVAKLLQRPQS